MLGYASDSLVLRPYRLVVESGQEALIAAGIRDALLGHCSGSSSKPVHVILTASLQAGIALVEGSISGPVDPLRWLTTLEPMLTHRSIRAHALPTGPRYSTVSADCRVDVPPRASLGGLLQRLADAVNLPVCGRTVRDEVH